MQEEDEERKGAVRAALEKGLWRERKDPKTGRTYYVNVQTRVSVWNLAKELAKSAPQPSDNRAHDSADERREQAKKWQDEEDKVMQCIADLEREKVQLETEISLLQGPTEVEEAALRDERDRLMDAKAGLEAVVAEDLRLRREKTAELQQMQASLDKLRLERQQELEAFESLRRQLAHLHQEHAEALADLQREETAMDSLQDEYRREEQLLEDAVQEESRLKEFLKLRESEVDRMKAELKLVCQQKAELQRHHERLAEDIRLKNVLLASDGAREEMNTSSSPLLFRLQCEVEQKRNALQQLERQQHLEEETEWMEVESTELRHRTALTEREGRRLLVFSKELSDQIRAVAPLVEAIEREAQRLVEELET